MLLMKKTYFDAIRSGQKTTTLRYWRRRQVRPGSIHNVRGLGRIQVEDVRQVDWSDITDADAQADGLADLNALRKALARMYPTDQRDGRSLWLVRFTYLQPDRPRPGNPKSEARNSKPKS
jgi:hypothetical protein